MKQPPMLLAIALRLAVAVGALPPLASATIINVPPDPGFASLGRLGPGTTVNIGAGGSTDAGIIADGSTINLVGGVLGGGVSAYEGSRVTVSGGEVHGRIFMRNGGQFLMTEGAVSGGVTMHSDVTARIEGGFVESTVEADFASQVTIAGGSVRAANASDGALVVVAGGVVRDDVFSDDGGVVRITGGEVLGDVRLGFGNYNYGLHQISGGTIRGHVEMWGRLSGGVIEGGMSVFGPLEVAGSSFTLDGVPLAGLAPGGSLTIDRRDATLAGVLADGSPFAIDLSGAGVDQIGPLAAITVVSAPEPSGAALLPLLACWRLRTRRAVGRAPDASTDAATGGVRSKASS